MSAPVMEASGGAIVGQAFRDAELLPLALADYISTISVSADGHRAVIGSLSGQATVHDAVYGTSIDLAPHPGGVTHASFSPRGDALAVGGHDSTVRLYTSEGAPRGLIEPAARGVRHMAANEWIEALRWSPDGRYLAVARGRTLLVSDDRGRLLGEYPPASSTITDLQWSVDGKRLGVTSYGGLTWYEPERLPHCAPARDMKFKGAPLALTVAPNGKWACAGFQDATIHIWRLWSGSDLAMAGYPSKIERLAFSDTSRWMAAACREDITVWDFAGQGPQGRSPAFCINPTRSTVTTLAWLPGSGYLLGGTRCGTVLVWRAPTSTADEPKPIAGVETKVEVSAMSVLGTSGLVLTGHADGSLRLLSLVSRS